MSRNLAPSAEPVFSHRRNCSFEMVSTSYLRLCESNICRQTCSSVVLSSTTAGVVRQILVSPRQTDCSMMFISSKFSRPPEEKSNTGKMASSLASQVPSRTLR